MSIREKGVSLKEERIRLQKKLAELDPLSEEYKEVQKELSTLYSWVEITKKYGVNAKDVFTVLATGGLAVAMFIFESGYPIRTKALSLVTKMLPR